MTDSGRREALEQYSLFETLRQRRSRRFSKRMTLDGPLAYQSDEALSR